VQHDGRENPRQPIRRIVIAGGGTAGWMVAAALSRTLGKQLDITLVESDEISTVGVGEATIPTLVTFHRLLELNEQEFMAATQATFKLGISFENWRDQGRDYIHSFGTTGKDHWTAGFQHFWLEGRRRGLAADYGEYCLELKAAQADRFAQLPRGGMNYAFHMDAGLYAKYLRGFSEGYGVRRVEGKIVAVNAADGRIDSLTLDSGDVLAGDLFVDCTGFRALLIGKTLGVEYEDWSHWLHCDSAIALQTESVEAPVPYTRSIAREAGWQWRIPLQHRVGNGIVYASRFLDEAAAQASLLANAQGRVLTTPRVIRFRPGQRRRTWSGNCIAIGLASGFLEPIESTSIHLIQRGVVRLLQMFPADGIAPADVEEYNRQTSAEIEHIRDFIILHYHVTERQDTPFWRHCREMEIPASLQHRIDLFRQTGRVFRVPNELFAENSWIQVMLGQGIVPEQHHPVARLMGDAELTQFLEGIRGNVARTVRQLPTHQAFIDGYCRARPLAEPPLPAQAAGARPSGVGAA
jgi:tryptophan halogenase